MSLNKIAKAINNLAESIRYHADHAGKAPILPMPGHSHGSVEGTTAPQNLARAEELEKRVQLAEDCDGFATNAEIESKCYAAEGFSAADILNADTPPLMYAVDDGPNTPSRVNDPRFIEGFDAGLVPAFGVATSTKVTPAAEADNSEDYVDPYDAPKNSHTLTVDELPGHSNALHVPGWQTLTVEELDANRENSAPPPPAAKEGEALKNSPPPADVTVDANGLPWDARIHSSGKTLLADDTWRLKRGVPDDERAEIEAELKQLMAIPVPPTRDAAAVDKDVSTPPPPPVSDEKITLMPQLIKAITASQLGAMMVTEAVKSVGLANISQLGARPDLVPAVAEALGL